jgi:hypothetical protein
VDVKSNVQGVVQGPFPKVDILEWLASGFFPNVSEAEMFKAVTCFLIVQTESENLHNLKQEGLGTRRFMLGHNRACTLYISRTFCEIVF